MKQTTYNRLITMAIRMQDPVNLGSRIAQALSGLSQEDRERALDLIFNKYVEVVDSADINLKLPEYLTRGGYEYKIASSHIIPESVYIDYVHEKVTYSIYVTCTISKWYKTLDDATDFKTASSEEYQYLKIETRDFTLYVEPVSLKIWNTGQITVKYI